MSKNMRIAISLVLCIIFTAGIFVTANKKYAEATKTATVVVAERYIPAGELIKQEDVKEVEVPVSLAKGLVKNTKDVVGKSSKVSILKGQFVYKDGIREGVGRRPGHVEVYIPTDLSSSAMALAGEYVNIHIATKSREAMDAPVLYHKAFVLHSLDANGVEIDPAKAKDMAGMVARGELIPVTVCVELPAGDERISSIVNFASQKMLYLTKVGEE